MKKTIVRALALPLVWYALSAMPVQPAPAAAPPSAAQTQFPHPWLQAPWYPGADAALGSDSVPDPANTQVLIDSSILFPTAIACSGCHGHDANAFALVTTGGQDVNMYDDWRSTMMANAARDPFWRAKVSHEILINPGHSLQIQDKCTACHAPAGHYQAKLKKQQLYYTLAELTSDTLGLDGVTCQACHAQAPGDNGSLHSGQLHFDTNFIRVAYGPYDVPFAPPMHDFVGITPKYGEHISDAGLCAGCHTLITPTADLSGQLTGGTFVEQATYHEWLNSRYDDEHDQITCQGCHMPQLQDEIIISANYQFLTPQFPFGLHELAGSNVSMLQLLRDNRTKLNIPAAAEHFDSTIAATRRMLREKTLDLTLAPGVLQGDTAFFDLKLLNKAGHKFPSGYPARRAWVEFAVINAAGDTVFHSGRYAPDFSLPDEDAPFEPHHDVINRPDQVQIYEMVPADVAGDFTNVLERGDKILKDNRLAPQGFTQNDQVYDTVQIVGAALADPDFNRFPDGSEGAGIDIVHFRVAIGSYTGALTVSARVWYQSMPPKWMSPMFAYSTPEIDSFRPMFEATDRTPELVASAVLNNVQVSPVSTAVPESYHFVRVVPSVTNDGQLRIDLPAVVRLRRISIWSASGRLVAETHALQVQLPREKGVYFLVVDTSSGRSVHRVVRTE